MGKPLGGLRFGLMKIVVAGLLLWPGVLGTSPHARVHEITPDVGDTQIQKHKAGEKAGSVKALTQPPARPSSLFPDAHPDRKSGHKGSIKKRKQDNQKPAWLRYA
jgi:hypothetical protein